MPKWEAPKPKKHWVHIPVLLIVGSFCAYWWYCHMPVPNKAVLWLAGVAVVMALWEMRPIHKAGYLLLVVWLMFIENRAIDKDRADFAADEACRRQEERQQFSDVGDAITTNVQKLLDHSDKQFRDTIGRSNRIIAGVGDSIKIQTGGDSFAYITFTPEPKGIQFNQFPATSEPQFLVALTSHGKYPLREVHVLITDNERKLAAMQEYNMHPAAGDFMAALHSGDTRYQYQYLRPQSPEAPSGDVELLGMYPFPKENPKRLSISFSSLNGNWNEALHLGLVNGTWHQCLSVMGPTVKQAIRPFIYCDSEWPEGKTLAENDWPRPKRPSPHRR